MLAADGRTRVTPEVAVCQFPVVRLKQPLCFSVKRKESGQWLLVIGITRGILDSDRKEAY